MNDDESSLDFISLVEDPAIEVDFFYFSKQTEKVKFEILNKEQRIVTGAAMIPNMDIPRIDTYGKVYNVYFSPATVRKAAELFFKNADPNKTNINHEDKIIKGTTVFESWIVDKENGKGAGKNFDALPDGTWMVSYKIHSDDIWNDFIKTGKVKGFSVEGNFIMNDLEDDETLSKLKEILNSDISEDEMFKSLQQTLTKQ